MRGEGVAPGEGRGDVLLAGHRLLRAVDVAGLGEHLGAAQQRLARHAGPVGALPADQFALDEDGGQPAPHDDVGDVLPRRPGPDHDDVIVCSLTLHSLPRRSAPRSFLAAMLTPCPLSSILSMWSTGRHAGRRCPVRRRHGPVRRRRLPADRARRHRRRRDDGQLGHERVGRSAAGRRRPQRSRLPGGGARGGRRLRAHRAGRRSTRSSPPGSPRPGGRAPGTSSSRSRGRGRPAAARSRSTTASPRWTAGWTRLVEAGDHVLALLAVEDVPVLNPDASPLLRLRGRYVDESGRPSARP